MLSPEAIDQGLLPTFQRQRTPALDIILEPIARLSESWVLLAILGVTLAFLVWRRRSRTAVVVALLALIAVALAEGTQALVQRKRPEVANPSRLAPDETSFPSRRVLYATTLYVTLGLLAALHLAAPWRTLVTATSLAFVLLIGISVLWLGLCYLTDVIAGWSVGLALAVTGRWIEESFPGKPAA